MRGIFLDVETGGLTPGTHALLALGAVAFEVDPMGAFILDEFSVLIQPHPEMSVSEKALDVQGIGWSSLESSARVEEGEALFRFFGWWFDNYQGYPFFAHNAPFDRDHLAAAQKRCNSQRKDIPEMTGRHANWICTINWANLLIAQGCMERPKDGLSLDSLAAHLGVQGRAGKAHSALEDATIGVRVAGKLARMGGMV